MNKKKYVVTIARQFGSMGRPIAMKLSEILGIEFYDRDIVDQAAEKLNLPEGHRVNHAIILGYAKTEILRGPERKENKVTFIR